MVLLGGSESVVVFKVMVGLKAIGEGKRDFVIGERFLSVLICWGGVYSELRNLRKMYKVLF
jgi:hypothetical protein